MLERNGWTVWRPRTGRKRWTASQPLPPQLILLDLTMPVMDGFTFLHALRESRSTGHPGRRAHRARPHRRRTQALEAQTVCSPRAQSLREVAEEVISVAKQPHETEPHETDRTKADAARNRTDVSASDEEIETVESRVVYRNRWMVVREDIIRRRDGSPGLYGVVEKSSFVAIMPIEPDGSVHLVEQYRYPVGERFWEFPQGAWEDRPNCDPLEVARGELREETGLVAGEMTYVGHLLHNYGFAKHGCHMFIARDLRFTTLEIAQEEQGLITRRFERDAFLAMVASGAIQDAVTVSLLALARVKGLIDWP